MLKVDVEQVERKFQQQQMIQWLEKEVTQAVMTKQVSKIVYVCNSYRSFTFRSLNIFFRTYTKDESLAQCMTELKKMATA